MAKNMEILTANLKAINPKDLTEDHSKLEFQTKELGLADIYPIVVFFCLMKVGETQS